MVEYNPYAYQVHEDPYPIYKQLRASAPLYRNDDLGFWALSRHADVLAGFKDVEHLSNKFGVSLEPSAHSVEAQQTMSFLAMDPPRHDRIRALVSRGFTPRRVAELEPRIRTLATGYVESFVDQGRCDFIKDFAGKLPMDVISEMLCVPAADRDMLRSWADTVVHREEGVFDVPPAGMEAAAQMIGYFDEFIKDRNKHPGTDLTSALLAAEIDGERLSAVDVIAFLFLMIIAGNETTTKLLGNAIYWICCNPGERGRLRDDPSLVPRWVEETLRYDNSTQALVRTVIKELTVHGCRLGEGERVVLLIGSANRDERVFPDPDRYDIMRDTSQMLSFGHATHFCLGAALARLEGRVALEEIHARLPDIELDMDGIERVHSINVRGFASLPIGFSS